MCRCGFVDGRCYSCSVEKPPTLFPISANSVQVCEYIYISSGTAPLATRPGLRGPTVAKTGREREAFRLQTLGPGTRDGGPGGSRRITSCWLYRHGADTTMEYTDTDGHIGNKHMAATRGVLYLPCDFSQITRKILFPNRSLTSG